MTDRRRFLRHSALAAVDLALPRGEPETILVDVHINPEMRVKVARGPARPRLLQHRWSEFLVRVRNEAGTTAPLRGTARGGWLDLEMLNAPPLAGVELEYRTVRLYSRECGLREASLMFDVGQGTQDLGFRNEVPVLFDSQSRSQWQVYPPGFFFR